MRFHPLKSGRDLSSLGWKGWSITVSIPSSRVGTDPTTDAIAQIVVFPSPQVGSGQGARKVGAFIITQFPSPQVGSGPEKNNTYP